MSLETIIGPLDEVLPFFKPDTIQHAAEITNQRRTHDDESVREELINNWFWTADSLLYRFEDGEAVLYLGDRTTNLIFENIGKAADQLKTNGNYFPSSEDIKRVLDSEKKGNALRIRLSELGLERYDNEYSYLEINPLNYNRLTKPQKEFAERIYGQGDDFKENMKMLYDVEIGKNIRRTRIHVLNPDYVKRNVREDSAGKVTKENSAIARACWLYSLYLDSDFIAIGRYLTNYNGLRGVLKNRRRLQ